MVMAEHTAAHMLLDDRLPGAKGAEQIMYMAAQQSAARRWTEAEFETARDAAPAGERWELIDGEVLVTPSPHWRHQAIVGPLLIRLHEYVRAQGVGTVFVAPLDVKLEPGMVTQPDLLVVPSGHLDDKIYFVSRLLLAVEVLSPSSARFDRVIKRPRYQSNRVPEYWVVDRESRTFERWQPDDERPAILSDILVWQPEGAKTPFELDIPSFFDEADAA
jgi:Uma2 family endonuclease